MSDFQETFLPLPAEPTREILLELPEDWDGLWTGLVDPDLVRGARVKPVVRVPEERSEAVDREALRKLILDSGAAYCRAPLVIVSRVRGRRESRHAVELPLGESLALFAAEVRAKRPDEKIEFAAAVAREADAGVEE